MKRPNDEKQREREQGKEDEEGKNSKQEYLDQKEAHNFIHGSGGGRKEDHTSIHIVRTSSRMSTSGSRTNAAANATLFRSPPDNELKG